MSREGRPRPSLPEDSFSVFRLADERGIEAEITFERGGAGADEAAELAQEMEAAEPRPCSQVGEAVRLGEMAFEKADDVEHHPGQRCRQALEALRARPRVRRG